MKKKRTYFNIILVLSSIIFGSLYFESQRSKQELQKTIDTTFKQQLGNIHSSFSLKVNDYTYRSILSSVSNAASMSELTSYEELNDDLDISLHYLFISLREDRSKEKVLARREELREIFQTMVRNPASREATDKIIQITKETFFNIEE